MKHAYIIWNWSHKNVPELQKFMFMCIETIPHAFLTNMYLRTLSLHSQTDQKLTLQKTKLAKKTR